MDKDHKIWEMSDADFLNFDIPKFVFDPNTPKRITYEQKVQCAYHNCTCDAINSHLLQKNLWLKRIAEGGKVLQMSDSQMQPLLDGDENGNIYSLLSIKNAMSLPIYCKQHDQKLFKAFEEKELDLNNALHLLKLSYRAFCASIAQEKRRNLFYNINPEINTFCSGPLFDEQRAYSTYVIEIYEKYRDDMFQHVKKKNTSDYIFRVVRMSRKRLCLSDVYVAENILSDAYGRKEDNPKLFPIFMHALPYENESILIYGYDKRQCNSSVISYIEKWSESIPDDIIIEWLVMADKWCVAPSFFGDNAEDCCEEIFRKKLNLQYGRQE